MAEWLRRWTRNPMGISRAGSNPVHDELFTSSQHVVKDARAIGVVNWKLWIKYCSEMQTLLLFY